MLKTEQEKFWQGEFGNEYRQRNQGQNWVAANTALFSKILTRTHDVNSVLELGANIGLNLVALEHLLPNAGLSAVEINEQAAAELQTQLPKVDLHVASILEFKRSQTWNLVFTKGVLIHINPDCLPEVYDLMYECSSRYVMVAEYYNPQPTSIPYRGHEGKLFKRDFAGEIMERFSDLTLLDYGFAYHRDPNYPQDDLSWFLMEKQPVK